MMKRILLICLLVFGFCMPAAASERVGFFFGTLTGGTQYQNFLEQYYATRDGVVELWDYSQNADTTGAFLERPADYEGLTRAVVMLGTDEGTEGYAEQLSAVVERFSQQGVEVVLLSPLTIHDPKHDRDNAVAEKRDIVRVVAQEQDCAFVDIYGRVLEYNNRLKTEHGVGGGLYDDGLTLSATGHMLLAQAVLEGCGDLPQEGKVLPLVTFDAGSNTYFDLENAIAGPVSDGSFTYTAAVLPFPITSGYEQLRLFYDIDRVFENRDHIRIIGLDCGSYRLSLNGTEAGIFSDVQLAGGVSLAEGVMQELITPVRHRAWTLVRAQRAAVESGDLAAADAAREALYEAAGSRTFTVTFEQVAEGAPVAAFADLQGHWGRPYADALARQGIVRGKDEATFDPEGSLTRGELLTLAVKLLGVEPTAGESYGDVDPAAWFAAPIATAKTLGLVPEAMVADGSFYPDREITREEMTAVLTAVYERTGRAAKAAGLDGFSDRDRIAEGYAETVAKAVGLGLVSGNADGTFDPQGGATRAEAATILFRLQAKL